MINKLMTLFIAILVFQCCLQKNPTESIVVDNEYYFNIPNEEEYNYEALKTFPIPSLDTILQYYETSGVQEKSPSESFFNPSNDGLFVFYTLFNNQGSNTNLQELGYLITHTYYKQGYGWDSGDQDQTFIELSLLNGPIQIGNSVKIGSHIRDITRELGDPILRKADSIFFIGSNRIICEIVVKNNHVSRIKYGQYNLNKKAYNTLASLTRAVEEIFYSTSSSSH